MSKNSKKGNKIVGGNAPKSGGLVSTKGFKTKPAVKGAATDEVAKPVQANPAKPTLKVVGKVDLGNRDKSRFKEIDRAKANKAKARDLEHQLQQLGSHKGYQQAEAAALKHYRFGHLRGLQKKMFELGLDILAGTTALGRYDVLELPRAYRAVELAAGQTEAKDRIPVLNALLDLVAEDVCQKEAANAAAQGFDTFEDLHRQDRFHQAFGLIPRLKLRGVPVITKLAFNKKAGKKIRVHQGEFRYYTPEQLRRALELYGADKAFKAFGPRRNVRISGQKAQVSTMDSPEMFRWNHLALTGQIREKRA